MSPEFVKHKNEILKKLQRRKKAALKGIEKWMAQLEDAKNWRQFEREGLVLQANLYQIAPGVAEVRLIDWETAEEMIIILDPRLPAAEQIKSRMRKSKKAKAGIPHLESQIAKLKVWAGEIDNAIGQVEASADAEQIKEIEDKFALNPVASEKPEKTTIKKLPYKEYTSSGGMKIWVGKGAKDNDQLTFTHANGSDWWLHVNEYSGSHVVIKSKDGSEPDPKTVSDAVQLAIGQSKAPKRGKIEVCITQVKYLKKYKGAKPGAVHLSKHKKILDEFDKTRYDSILRLLP